MEFDLVTKEHIIQGIKDFEEKGFPNGFGPSSTYDLIYEGKTYPPKAVMAYANFHATGRKIERYFKGGVGTDCFKAFERNGFKVIKKEDPVKLLISGYKKRIDRNHLKNEVYKWELIKQYGGRPNTNAEDFYQELKEVKFGNLIYAMAQAVVYQLAKNKPVETLQLFENLYDETKDLTERVKYFNEESLKIYRGLGETLQHHQDERSISTYLTFHYPDKYTFYKSSFYKKYCRLLGIKEAKKKEKYTHYLNLIKELIEEYIVPDKELIEQVKSLIPEYYDGSNHNLLAQDILYQMLDQKDQVNYWIFQGNPKAFDFETALRQEILTDWTVSAHKDKIKVDDKVILWITGDNSGCYALGEVTSEPHERTSSPDDHLWKEEDKSEFKADIKITHNFVDSPILKESIDSMEELKDLKVGYQGTNFSATKEQYDTLLEITSENINDYIKVKENLDQEKLKRYLDIIREIINRNSLTPDDERLSFNVRKEHNRLVFIIGNRYAFMIEEKKGKTNYSFISDKVISDDSGQFKDRKGNLEDVYWNLVADANQFNKEIIIGCENELKKGDRTPYRRFNNSHFSNEVFKGIIHTGMDNYEKNKSLNQILYGPPGTGKTYQFKERLFDKYTIQETSITVEKHFEDTVANLTWWQVIALALLELGTAKVNDILENRWVAKKAELSESKNVRATLWGTLQMHTILESKTVAYTQRQVPYIFDKNDDKTWSLLDGELKEQVPELYDILNAVNNFKANPNTVIKNYDFVTFHQSFAYEDFVEGIKPIMAEEVGESKELGYKIENGVFKNLCIKAQNDPDNKYAIFIDEINRGNVSAIFGELITLIEVDKRKGAVNELSIKLPYSKKEFSVPSNLDIYGSMNTADRSVEALDTALRRRFVFEEVMPNPSLLSDITFKGFNLEQVLTTINDRVEALLDRDHTIGHSYFIKLESGDTTGLSDVFNNNIIPLLQEYFYNDYEKIALVLGPGFVKEKEAKKNIFPEFKNIEEPEIDRAYELIPSIDDIEEAVGQLLGISNE